MFWHFIGLISDQTERVLETELNEQECLPFFIDFISASPTPILGITETLVTSPAGWY